MLVVVLRILGVVLGEGLVGGHDGVGGGVPEPYGPAQGAHPLLHVLLVDPLPTELRLRLPSRAAAWQLQSAPAAFSTLANSHTCEADRHRASQRTARPPAPHLFFRDHRPTNDGCSSPLFTLLTGCSQDGRLAPAEAAASCRRSRHRHLRRRGRSVGGRACELVSL